MKFYIEVVEQRSTTVCIEAENVDEALEIADVKYKEDDICLDNGYETIDDGTVFYDMTSVWENAPEASDFPYFPKDNITEDNITE